MSWRRCGRSLNWSWVLTPASLNSMSVVRRRYVPFRRAPVFHFNTRSHRLAQIKSLSRKIEERDRLAAKIEKSIKVARVSTPPRDDPMCRQWCSFPSGQLASCSTRSCRVLRKEVLGGVRPYVDRFSYTPPSELRLSRHWVRRGIATHATRRLRKVGNHNPC